MSIKEKIPFQSRAPEIETAAAVTVAIGSGALYLIPENERENVLESTDKSPVGMDQLLDATGKIGLPDQAVLLALTFISILGAAHGTSRIIRRGLRH